MFRKIRNLEKQMLDVQKDIEALKQELKQENEAVKLELFEVKNPAKYKCGDWVKVVAAKYKCGNSNWNVVEGSTGIIVASGYDKIKAFDTNYSFIRTYTVMIKEICNTLKYYEHDIIGIADSSPEVKTTTVTNYKPKVDKASKKNRQKRKDVLTAEQYAKFPMGVIDYAIMMKMTIPMVWYRVVNNKLPEGITVRKKGVKYILEYKK
ncbi:MAG: hypothetical protein WC939_04135 [Acholeplasmataceae bacterium]